jgi:hypothetical protein
MARRKKSSGKSKKKPAPAKRKPAPKGAVRKRPHRPSNQHHAQPKAARKSPSRKPVRRAQSDSTGDGLRPRPKNPDPSRRKRKSSGATSKRSQAARKGWITRRKNLEGTPQAQTEKEIRELREENKRLKQEQARREAVQRAEAIETGIAIGMQQAAQRAQKLFVRLQNQTIRDFLISKDRIEKPKKRWRIKKEGPTIPIQEVYDFLAQTGIDDMSFFTFYKKIGGYQRRVGSSRGFDYKRYYQSIKKDSAA